MFENKNNKNNDDIDNSDLVKFTQSATTPCSFAIDDSDAASSSSSSSKKKTLKPQQITEKVVKLIEQSSFDVAMRCLADSILLYPKNEYFYQLFGLCSSNVNRFSLAARQFEKAVRLAPKQRGLSLNAGHCYHHLNDTKRAIRSYEREFKLEPTIANLQLLLTEHTSDDFTARVAAKYAESIVDKLNTKMPNDEFASSNSSSDADDATSYDVAFDASNDATTHNATIVAALHSASTQLRAEFGVQLSHLLIVDREITHSEGFSTLLRAATWLAQQSGNESLISTFYVVSSVTLY